MDLYCRGEVVVIKVCAIFITAEVPRRSLCRCAFGMAAAVATLRPELLAEFEANHRSCAPCACVCACLFCVPGGSPDETGAGAVEDGGDKRVVVVEAGGGRWTVRRRMPLVVLGLMMMM